MNSIMPLYKDSAAIVTGGAGLLGREHAIALAEIGYKVFLFDIDHEGLKSAKKYVEEVVTDAQIQTVICDITSEDEIRTVMSTISNDSRQLKCLINNASMNPSPEKDLGGNSIENFDSKLWNREISVGLTGAILMCKNVRQLMVSGGGGYILNIASDLSVISPDQRIYRVKGSRGFVKPVSYSIIKTGLIGFTRYLATYWAEHNIRVNALSPGGVENGQSQQFVSNLEALIPMSRMAKKNEYRGAVQYLCSDQSSYMTGQNLIVDGGRSIW